MALSQAAKDFLLKKDAPRTPLKEISSNDAISEKEAELRLRKLQIEIDKLEKPDTSIDYYSKMLELQEKSFAKQLEMANAQNSLKLEIEKLKLAQEMGSGDFAEDFLMSLTPLLPELIKKQQLSEKEKLKKEVKGGEIKNNVEKIKTAKDLEDYKLKIKAGAITLEQAYEDFKISMPEYANKVTFEEFKVYFEKLKNG